MEREELLHASITFIDIISGDSLGLCSGLISFRNNGLKQFIAMFLDYDNNSEDAKNLFGFFEKHEHNVFAHIDSIKGQDNLPLTCFNCAIVTPYSYNSPLGLVGQLIEILCDSFIEGQLINSYSSIVNWNKCYVAIDGLYIFSKAKEESEYSVIFKIDGNNTIKYCNYFSKVKTIFYGNYRSFDLTPHCSIEITFNNTKSVSDIVNYVNCLSSFFKLIFDVRIIYGNLTCGDEQIEFTKDNHKKNPSVFWLPNSINIENTYNASSTCNALFTIQELEDNSDILLNNYYALYIEHPLSATVLDRIYDAPSCDIDMFEDVVRIVKALDDLTYQKNKGLSKRILELCSEIQFSARAYSMTEFVNKIVEIRHSECHSRKLKTCKVTMYEIRNLYYDTRRLFLNYMKTKLLK